MAKKLSTTPKGIAVYPRLTGEPDYKFNKAGVWSVKLALLTAEAQEIIERIDEVMQTALVEAKEKFVVAKAEYAALTPKARTGKKPPKAPELMDAPYFPDEENGVVTFTFKMTASGETKKKEKFTQKPVIYDKNGLVVKGEIKLGGGSTIRVSYELVPFATALGAGASLRLKAVQVIDLVEWGANAEYYGFVPEEGGFSSEVSGASEEQSDEVTAAEWQDDKDAAAAVAPATGSESDDF